MEPEKKLRCVCMVATSGGGKDTYIRANPTLKNAFIASTDSFFTDRSTKAYDFIPRLLGKAHDHTFREFIHAAFVREPVLVVNNTNTSLYEILPYIRVAEVHGYEIQIVQLLCDPGIAWARSIHGAPEEAVRRQHARIAPTIKELEALSDAMNKQWIFTTVNTENA